MEALALFDNHSDIGTMYIVLSMIAALIGGRCPGTWLELAQPGIEYITDTQFYNVLVTARTAS